MVTSSWPQKVHSFPDLNLGNSQAQVWAETWVGTPYSGNVHLALVYLYDADPVDTDNIIKPIQDALIGLVYEDDSLVTDVESHRRSLSGTFDVALCPLLLLHGIISGSECVYVRIRQAKALESYL